MRRNGVLLPKFGTLRYAETVLLVDDNHAQILENHLLFEQRMCPDKQIDFARLQSL